MREQDITRDPILTETLLLLYSHNLVLLEEVAQLSSNDLHKLGVSSLPERKNLALALERYLPRHLRTPVGRYFIIHSLDFYAEAFYDEEQRTVRDIRTLVKADVILLCVAAHGGRMMDDITDPDVRARIEKDSSEIFRLINEFRDIPIGRLINGIPPVI